MAFIIHRWFKITHIQANVQHHRNFRHHVICDKWGQYAKHLPNPHFSSMNLQMQSAVPTSDMTATSSITTYTWWEDSHSANYY
jgi:hypothetical protein